MRTFDPVGRVGTGWWRLGVGIGLFVPQRPVVRSRLAELPAGFSLLLFVPLAVEWKLCGLAVALFRKVVGHVS